MRNKPFLLKNTASRILLLSVSLIGLIACESRSLVLDGGEPGVDTEPNGSNPVNPPFVRSFGGDQDTEPTAVATDQHGNIYLAGNYNGRGDRVTLDGVVVEGHGKQDIFLAKLDVEGKLIWLKTTGGHIEGKIYGISMDSAGNGYATGVYSGELTLGATTLEKSLDQPFLASFESSGKWAWARTIPWGGIVDVGPEGNLYMGGTTGEDATEFDGYPVPAKSFILAQIDNQGSARWLTDLGDTFQLEPPLSELLPSPGHFIGVDANGVSYATGENNFPPVFGTRVASVDPQGALVDTMVIDHEGVHGLDPEGNLYTWFWSNSSPPPVNRIFYKRDQKGGLLWEQQMGIYEQSPLMNVRPGINGEVYLIGEFTRTIVYGDTTFTSRGVHDIAVMKLDRFGEFQWLRVGGGPSNDDFRGAAVDPSGRLIVVGVHRGGRFAETDLLAEYRSVFIWALAP